MESLSDAAVRDVLGEEQEDHGGGLDFGAGRLGVATAGPAGGDADAEVVVIPVSAISTFLAATADQLATELVLHDRRGALPGTGVGAAAAAATGGPRGPARSVAYKARYRCSRGKPPALHARKARRAAGAVCASGGGGPLA
jgi:hypothetical protein